MREAMKIYGGDNYIAPSADDVEQATGMFREELSILKDLFAGYDLTPSLTLPEIRPLGINFWQRQLNMFLFLHRSYKQKAGAVSVSAKYLSKYIF